MGNDTIVLLGVNHKTAPLEVREKFALTAGYIEPLTILKKLECLKECYLLSTCNRVELLFTCDDPLGSRKEVLENLFGSQVTHSELDNFIYHYENEDAVHHLFMVSSSLDSMIVGESQILGQLKEAFRHASELKTSGLVLNKLLHKSFTVAKRVRTETKIGASAVSISYAAVELARKIFGKLSDKKVLLVGAGEMAELAAEHLVGQGVEEVVVANRTLENAVKLAQRFNGRAVALEEMEEQLTLVDIIVSSTGASGLILTKEQVKPVMRRRRNRPLFFIDIAVPRDLDQGINELDNVFLYDIDDLKNVVERNKAERDLEAVKAERIVGEEAIKFCKWLDKMEVTPTIVELRQVTDGICRGEMEKTLSRLDGLSEEQLKSIERMAQAISAKLLHHPMQYLKNEQVSHETKTRINTVRTMFGLNNRGNG
ncbi:MAG: glutamyl-tRNA reductase [Desulfobulbaceae bacterium]|nr:glutamyl-tRNA reductase [Desulfobulbaceae bacterium]